MKFNHRDGIVIQFTAFGYTIRIVPKFKLFIVWNPNGSVVVNN